MIFCLYQPSTNPLLYLYFTSTNNLLVLIAQTQAGNRNRLYIPKLGTKHSRVGNKTFPRWEQNVSTVGIKRFHGGNKYAQRGGWAAHSLQEDALR